MYHYQSLGNPRKKTLLRALKRHPDQFVTFSGLTWDLINNHLPPSKATEKGHMIMTRKGLKSTRSIAKTTTKDKKGYYIVTFYPGKRSAWPKKIKYIATQYWVTETIVPSTGT